MAVTRVAKAVGLLGVVTTVVLIGLQHIIPPSSQVSVLSRTISEYALLPDGWVFNLGVVALVLASLAVVVSLVSQGVIKAVSAIAPQQLCSGVDQGVDWLANRHKNKGVM